MIVTQADLRGAIQNAPLHEHVRQDLRDYFSKRTASLMGEAEMECAVRRMVCLCVEHNQPLDRSIFNEKDFRDDGFERDGLFSLMLHGWADSAGEGLYTSRPALNERIRSRFPELSI